MNPKKSEVLKKSNATEYQRRVTLVTKSLLDGLSKQDILHIPTVMKWSVSVRQIEYYIQDSQKRITEIIEKERNVIVGLAYRKYNRIYQKALADKNLKEANNAVTNQLRALGLLDNNFIIQQNNQINNYGKANEFSGNEKIASLIEEFAERSIEASYIESDTFDATSN